MAIIKSNSAPVMTRDAVVLDLGDVARQAQQLRASAEARARQILDQAQQQAKAQAAQALEAARRQGHEQGFAAGLEAGTQQGRQQAHEQASASLKALEDRWLQVIGDFDAHRDELERSARQEVLTLALKLAEKVVHRAIETDPAIVGEQVAAALAHVLRPLDITVRLHPEDRPIVNEALPALTEQFRHLKHIQLVDDPSIQRGGCVISGGHGHVDAQIDTQLRRIAEVLLPAAETT